MHRTLSSVFLAALTAFAMHAQQGNDRGASDILTPGKAWNLLGEGYQLTADPTVDHEGNVWFTDARRNRILKIDLEGRITTWKDASNGSHGIAYGPDGRLYAGQHGMKRIVAFSNSGTESVVAQDTRTHHLTVTSRNHVYFTVAPASQVWLVDAAGRKRVVHEPLDWPRGVRASPDESLLLVTEARKNRIWSFRIQSDGSLIDGKTAYHLQASDGTAEIDPGGMAFDSEGFLYVATAFGVQVFDRQRRVTAIIAAPGSEGLTNLLFAGPGRQWLYVMEADKVYRRPVRRRGAPPFPR